MEWSLDFISEEDFKKHVRATIMKYGEKLESYDLKRFNSNLIDPIKLIFDKSVYRTSWEEIVNKLFVCVWIVFCTCRANCNKRGN